MKNILFSFLILSTILFSCDNEDETPIAGDIAINFDLTVGDDALVFESQNYVNEAGNVFSVSSFWMYISNIKLVGANGTEDYSVSDSYHLIEATKSLSDLTIDLDSIPSGTYRSIEFAIGVDEAVNTDISAVKGELDPGRAWNWNTGYKFVSLEGNFYPQTGDPLSLIMHIGLNQNYRELSFNLSNELTIDGGITNLDFSIDILKMFEGAHTIDFNQTNSIKAQPVESGYVADNYAAGMLQIIE